MKRWMLAALVMLLTPATLSAKGRTTKIVLTCQGLPGPVTMTDGDALDFRFGPSSPNALAGTGSVLNHGALPFGVAVIVMTGGVLST